MLTKEELKNYQKDIKKEKTCKNLEKRMKRKIVNAIFDFEMIKENETILLGISGGKDSMVLSYFLNEIRKSSKMKFNIIGVYIFMDFLKDYDVGFKEKKDYFENILNIPLKKITAKVPSNSKINDGLGKSCQRCSYARRITLMKLCKKFGATKIAFGHHMDDIVVTTFMNMISGRRLQIMPPINQMKTGDISFIRPMSYLREKDILRFALNKKIPFSTSICPIGNNKRRDKIKKEIIWQNEKVYPNFVENTFWAFIKNFKEKAL